MVRVTEACRALGGRRRMSASVAISIARARALSDKSPSARDYILQMIFLIIHCLFLALVVSPNARAYRKRSWPTVICCRSAISFAMLSCMCFSVVLKGMDLAVG